MDKKYRKNTTLIAVILLCVSVFGCCILTVQKAEWIKNDLNDEVYEKVEDFCVSVNQYYNYGELRDTSKAPDSSNALGIIPSFYKAHEDVDNAPFVSSDVGFHSALSNSKGEIIAEYQPCIIFEKNSDDIKNRDVRVLLFGDEFYEEFGNQGYRNDMRAYYKNEALSQFDFYGVYGKDTGNGNGGIVVDGTCDDTFVYLKKLTWYNRMYRDSYGYIPREDKTDKGNTDFESWLDYKNSDYGISMVSLVQMGFWNDKYNMEAKELCRENLEQFQIDGNHSESFGGGLFTTDMQLTSRVTNVNNENDYYVFSAAYVFHPISMAISELTYVYIAIIAFAIIAIVIMAIIMKKSYEKQQAAENNRRDLTRGIAHELKTPLAITRGYVENWEYLPEEEKEEITKTMMSEMDHMNKMVTDLLELSHMEAGMKTVQWEEVDLYSLASSILKRMKNIISERDLNVKLIPEDVENADDFVAEADLEMIRIAMSNFISNAVKYAEKEVTVTLTQSSKKVRFEIENDGSTIDSNEIKRVWDEFYKSDSVNRSTIGSSGLGLAITKNIFILHNAEYGCNSENGKVKFFFEIKKEK